MDGEKIKGALLERALGYDADEVVEEYGFSEGVPLKVRALQSGESWDYLPSAN